MWGPVSKEFNFENNSEQIQNKDYDRKLELKKHLTSEEHLVAGMHFRYGINRTVDYRKAFEHFQQGKEVSVRCKYELAVMYEHGIGTSIDKEKANLLFAELSSKGFKTNDETWCIAKGDTQKAEVSDKPQAGATSQFFKPGVPPSSGKEIRSDRDYRF